VYNSNAYWEIAAPWGVIFSPSLIEGVALLMRKNNYSLHQYMNTGTKPPLPGGGQEL
jgi:hypothetical protein